MAIWKCESCGATREGRCKPKKCQACGANTTFVKEGDDKDKGKGK
ncbi:MAG: rubredoxin [Rubrobacteridae bacterium]|nr:rubredoxin [Rubrobacteridae bacterium]